MSRNGHFRLGPSLATAYGPGAYGSAEGDILSGLREDDAGIQLSGLREDDAQLRLGGAYDGATGSAEGSAEGSRDRQLGVSAYDRQPGVLVTDGRMGGMVEDHFGVRMGGLREDDANIGLEGLREDDANIGLEGLREDDARISMGGLREDDAAISLEGLREQNAEIDFLATAYAPDASGAAEGDKAWMGGLREDDANLRLGDEELGVSAYDLGISAYDLGDVDSLNAEAAAIEQEQTLADMEVGRGKGMKIRNIARNAARVAAQDAKAGAISSYADAKAFVQAKVDAAVSKLKSRLNTRLSKLDELGADAVKKAMAEFGPKIEKTLSKKVSVAGVRMGMILRGLREDDAQVSLGRRRAFKPAMAGAEVTPPQLIAATGFHERFPVVVDIAGVGRIRTSMNGSRMSGLFDFLKPKPSAEEYLGKIKVILAGWTPLEQRMMKLNDQSKTAILGQMTALNNEPDKYRSLAAFLSEGYAAYTDGRWDRVVRLEAYLPTLQTLVAQAETLGPAGSAAQETARVNTTATNDVNKRIDAQGETFLQKAAPIAAGVGGAAALTALLIAVI